MVAPFGNSIISEEGMQKIYKIHAQKIADSAVRQNERVAKERLRREQIKQFEEDNEEDKEILLN